MRIRIGRAMDKNEVAVPASLDGSRLDKALRELFSSATRARTKRAIDEGKVLLNGRRAPKGALVKTGDVLTLKAQDELVGEAAATPEPGAPLEVCFESEHVVVASKPAGQPTAPLRGGETGTLANALVARYPELAGLGHSPREPGLVHRLDTDTSGLVVAARTAEAFDVLAAALRDGALDKSYYVVCAEEGLPDEGSVDFPLANHPKDRRRVYPCIHPRDVVRYAPRPASTRFRVVRRANGLALVEASAGKALRHQIRAHFAALGHPLVGDELYGGESRESLGRHALHAFHVHFAGPPAAMAFDVKTPLPPDLEALFGKTA
jgi:23S rRNA pseudouridine1911/1915/1917 synthase